MESNYIRIPELFDYNQPRVEEYHSPRLSKKDKSLIALFELVNAADWAQTQQIRRDPARHSEARFPRGSANLIGKHPSRGAVNALMGSEALLYPLIVDNLDSPWRDIFQLLAVGAKAYTVNNNRKAGLDILRW